MSAKPTEFDFDVIILGGGSAGYAAARTAHAAGAKAAVIEGGPEVGGLCILRGCMPTKALLYAAEVRHLARQGKVWGLQPGPIPFDWSSVLARKNAQIKDFADYRQQQLEDGRFQFIRAEAHFVDPHRVVLSNGRTVSARSFIICTGSEVATSPLPQLALSGFITSDDALKLKNPPKSLIVLGGGAVGVEFAQFFARFDVAVTLVQRSEHLLRDFDEDSASVIADVFRREGIQLHTGTRLLDARREGDEKVVTFEQGGRTLEVRAEEILVALGRSPRTASLALEKAGVTTKGPRILTDDYMRTSTPHIYAAGDCTSPHEIVHLAVQQGETAAHNIVHPERPRRMDYRLLVTVVFTDPQIGHVGLTQKEADSKGIAYLAASHPFNDHGKSLIMEARDGFVKLLADPATGEILGGTCVGPSGGELIHEIIAAMAKRMTVHELAAMPHYHPTLAEIWTYPAEELAGRISV
ncbi:MAG TPA: NAD(P)/FAD-dependent oxidoreductase [Verrucomicrobiae bacterium]|nr:NAD(P)/FAD-dependent oxidoreductase [Verrucomicrobiae bacterium]